MVGAIEDESIVRELVDVGCFQSRLGIVDLEVKRRLVIDDDKEEIGLLRGKRSGEGKAEENQEAHDCALIRFYLGYSSATSQSPPGVRALIPAPAAFPVRPMVVVVAFPTIFTGVVMREQEEIKAQTIVIRAQRSIWLSYKKLRNKQDGQKSVRFFPDFRNSRRATFSEMKAMILGREGLSKAAPCNLDGRGYW